MEDTQQENYTTTNNSTSLLATLFWGAVIIILPNVLAGFALNLYASFSGVENTDTWFAQIEVLVAMGFVMYLFAAPLLFWLAKNAGDGSSAFEFLSLKKHRLKTIAKIVLFSLGFWLAFSLLGFGLEIPEEPFMLELKNARLPIWFVGLSVCVLAPIIEETIFRGFLFKRIALTKLGTAGAVIITSFVFAFIHSQYSMLGVVMVLILGLYFAWLRVKYNSTTLAIVGHGVCNLLTLIGLYYFT